MNSKKIFGIFSLFLCGLIGISFILFKTSDSSIFLFDSKNYLNTGIVSYFISSLTTFFLYIFGPLIFIILLSLLYFSYFCLNELNFNEHWERFVGLLIIFFNFSFLINYYEITTFGFYGLINQNLKKILLKLFDKNILFICIYSLLIISFILIFRFNFISLVRFFNLKKIEKIIYKIIKVIVEVKYIICLPFKSVYQFIYTLLNPSNELDDLVFEYEYGQLLKNFGNLNEDFWFQFIDKKQEVISSKVVPITKTDIPSKKPIIFEIDELFETINDVNDNKKILKDSEIQAKILEEKLKCFGILGSVISIKHGPVITLFEYEPQIDTKISKIISLEDDLALALETTSIRIIAPIPGKSVVGFEIANKYRRNVLFSNIVKSESYKKFTGYLPLIFGEDVTGNNVVADLVKMPHLLIAGSTGSGKSIALNSMIISLLCKCSPEKLKLILIDPKRLEFTPYNDIGHLLFPIVTLPQYAIAALKWLIKEMENRYEMMAQVGSKNIFDYNNYCKKNNLTEVPFIVVVIDELADLMITTGREIEDSIIRIAQMARACGIHMIVATQRPSVDVITGLIKVNFPSRISFKVASKIDSRTILDSSGAEKLLGKGDMLFQSSQSSHLERLHGAYVNDDQISNVINNIKRNYKVEYLNLIEISNNLKQDLSDTDDQLYKDVINFLNEIDEVSISLLQRRFKIGYNRSARIIELLEAQGYILPSEGGRPRKIVKAQR